MTIADNITKINQTIPSHVKLIAVSKYKSNDEILEAYSVGQRRFGENKVQEMVSKWESLPKDIEWHFIGHLQTNKVKYITPFVSLIHSVDSFKLLQVIDKEAQKANRVLSVLLQFHIANEETKFGFTLNEAEQMINHISFKGLNNISIHGVMGMGTLTNDPELTRKEFLSLASIFKQLKEKYFNQNNTFSQLSMGMSHDYSLAIDCGSTMIRVGSSIFGER